MNPSRAAAFAQQKSQRLETNLRKQEALILCISWAMVCWHKKIFNWNSYQQGVKVDFISESSGLLTVFYNKKYSQKLTLSSHIRRLMALFSSHFALSFIFVLSIKTQSSISRISELQLQSRTEKSQMCLPPASARGNLCLSCYNVGTLMSPLFLMPELSFILKTKFISF